jgi:hypothetical protein
MAASAFAYENVSAKNKIGVQLENYFSQESYKATHVFDTYDNYYIDQAYVDNKPVPHYFRMAVAATQLKQSWSPSDDCSSTGTCRQNSEESYTWQFIFLRKDVTAETVGVAGDGKICVNKMVGSDANGGGIYQEVCNTDSEEVYYGDLTENTPDKMVFKIKRFSTTSTSQTYGVPFATLVVQKNAAGQKTASFVITEPGEVLPTGNAQTVQLNVTK